MAKQAIEPISIDNPQDKGEWNFLDKLAMFLLEEKNGRPKGFILQTFLDFVGLPTILSAGDLMGLLRGYLNMRQGNGLKGVLEIVTAIVPWVPTGPVHYFIETLLPTKNPVLRRG